MNFIANLPNLSGLFKGLWQSTPAVEIIEPEKPAIHTEAKEEITSLMTRITEYLNDIKDDHPNIDNITSMSNGYLAITMVNRDNDARQITTYSLGSSDSELSMQKENSLIRKEGDDFTEEKSSETLIAHNRAFDDRAPADKLTEVVIEDISEMLGIDQVALVSAVKGGDIIEGQFKSAPEALTAD